MAKRVGKEAAGMSTGPSIEVSSVMGRVVHRVLAAVLAAVLVGLAPPAGLAQPSLEADWTGAGVEPAPDDLERAPDEPEISWSDNPGVYEAELRRRYHNPLYLEHRREVAPQELLDAKRRDAERAWEVLELYVDLASEKSRLARADTASGMGEALARIDEAIQLAMWAGGEAYPLAPSLQTLRNGLLEKWKQLAGDDTGVAALLGVERRARKIDTTSEAARFVAQVEMPESPIEEYELGSALLSEDPRTIRVALKTLKPVRRKAVNQQARRLVSTLRSEGIEVEALDQKAAAIGL